MTRYTLEAAPFSGREESRLVRYDRFDLLSPDAADDLLADLRKFVPIGGTEGAARCRKTFWSTGDRAKRGRWWPRFSPVGTP
jgi:hypothetical protein